jgi:hypothetical protein
MAGFQTDLMTGACVGLADLLVNSAIVIGLVKPFMPVGVITLMAAHSADKTNAFILSASLGAMGSSLQRTMKGPMFGGKRR